MKDYCVYAIKSLIDGRIYVGMSSNPERRMMEHNAGQVRSTKGYKPWVMVYRRLVGPRAEARAEEKKLKSGRGKEFLKSNIPR